MITCIGPLCIPVWQIWVFLAFLFAPVKVALESISERWRKKEFLVWGFWRKENGEIDESNSQNYESVPSKLNIVDTKEQWEQIWEGKGFSPPMTEAEKHSTFTKDCFGGRDLVLTMFSADWCSPCQKAIPVLRDLSKRYPRCDFYKVDSDALSYLQEELKIQALPTFVFWRNKGQILKTIRGCMKNELRAVVENNTRKTAPPTLTTPETTLK